MEGEKPFPCKVATCRQSFATEHHLAEHQKCHEMMLNLNLDGKSCFIIDKTPTPSRLIRNLEEVGLFEENIFDVTFRKAIEEKQQQNPPSVRRMISIQNEDTLHTPHIPLHLYKSDDTTEGEKSREIEDEATKIVENRNGALKRKQSVPRKRKRERDLDKLLPPPSIMAPDTTPIPIGFPDSIQIQPKWTVLLQYPCPEPSDPVQTTSLSNVKQRLKTLLVKNESSKGQTITLTPPSRSPRIIKPVPSGECTDNEISPPQPVKEKREPVAKPKTFSAVERNNAAAKRYRNKKQELFDNLQKRNNYLEEENRKLKLENKMLKEKLEATAATLAEKSNGYS